MKKLVLFSCVLLSACSLFPQQKKFKNPIFYEPMYGHRIYYDKVITPVGMVHFHDEEILPAKCEILSDIGYQIVMKCLEPAYRTTPEMTFYYRFANAGKREGFNGNCAIQEEIFYDKDFQKLAMRSWFNIKIKKEESCGETAPSSYFPFYND